MKQEVLDVVAKIAKEAGKAILPIYASDFSVVYKNDKSPLTKADTKSQEIIKKLLENKFSGIPLLSEEGRTIPYEERSDWSLFWLVDPLDGTKEFVKRNGEFTVNIALIENNSPAFGVVYLPVSDILYYGGKRFGAFKKSGNEAAQAISVSGACPDGELVVVKSRSHPSAELTKYLEQLKVKKLVPAGSSLKFCLVAEGTADLYPRLGPTWEWDTAAGQAVVEGAGGRVVTLDNVPIFYNKKNLLNDFFVVWGC